MKQLLLILAAGSSIAHAQVDDCTDCPAGEVPGMGTVTITYNMRRYVAGEGECNLTLCSRVDLTGTIETDGVQTYHAIDVPVEGNLIVFDDTCCSNLTNTVIAQAGIITAYIDPFAQEGDAIGFYANAEPPFGEDQDIFFPTDFGTCRSFSSRIINYEEGGAQTIQTITVRFTGGACVADDDDDDDDDDGPPGGGGGGGPGEPPEPPVDPPTDEPPDRPDPPDAPEPPDTEPPDDDPEPPDPPEPPEPPIDDACCAAITSRLDILILYSADLANIHRATNLLLHNLTEWEMAMFNALIDDDHAILPDMQVALYDIRAYLGQMQAFMRQDAEYQHDQTWYLQQIYASTYQGGDFQPPDTGDAYILGSPSTSFAMLPGKHLEAQSEANQVFGLPDIADYETLGDTASWTISMAFARQYGVPIADFILDLEPYTPVRDLVHLALVFLCTFNATRMVWGEFRKT